ncbi:cheY-homologous receiver domain, partial [Rhizoctonia solani]
MLLARTCILPRRPALPDRGPDSEGQCMMTTVRLRDAMASNDSSPTSAATSLPLSAPLPLPPELTQNSKFGFAFPDAPNQTSLPLIPPPPPIEDKAKDGETKADEDMVNAQGGDNMLGATPLPRLERAFSMPIASQMGHLRHPRRPPGFGSPGSSVNSQPYTPGLSTIYSAPQSAMVKDYVAPQSVFPTYSGLSLELADTAQLIIQTLLQLSPPHMLDPAKEQFSGCTLQLPTTSIGGMLHAMKGLNWMSIRLAGFVESEQNAGLDSVLEESKEETFDIGETLQCVGDLLSGIAAQAGVQLVIYHADVGLKHVGVKGDEGGASYALSHIVRQVMATTEPGETIELGLSLEQHESKVNCIFDIVHRLNSPVDTRIPPQLDTVILRRLLTHIRATLQIKPTAIPSSPSLVATPDTPITPVSQTGTTQTYTLTIPFIASSLPPPHELSAAEQAERQPFPTIKLANEPTLEDLFKFQEKHLKGKRATFYANPKSSFAQHLTSYLTTWGVGIEHRAMDEELPTGETEGKTSFIIIDDDVSVLRARLTQLHAPFVSPALSRKRPSLASNHRPKSSPHIRQLTGISETSSPVVIHFTSLGNYKVVRDVIQSVLGTQSYLEVLVIPKPAGPRRFLTALHTALTRPLIDPVFAPIATSPSSPSQISITSRYKPSSPVSTTRPSPLAIDSNRDYFNETADLLDSAISPGVGPRSETGGGGIVVQNIDGKHTGIFFNPPQKSGSGGPGRATTIDTSFSNKRPHTLPARSGTADSLGRDPGEQSPAYQENSPFQKSPTSPITPAPATVKSPHMPPTIIRTSSGPVVPKVKPTPSGGAKETRRRSSNGGPGNARSPTAVKSPTAGPGGKKPVKKGKDTGIVPPISVLIVEDNPINQNILSTFIRRKKIKYEVANNGLQAVEKWKTGRFHLIFMDIQMPVMDGIEATREIRRLEKIQHGPASTPPIESPGLLSESKQLFTPSSDSKLFGSSGPSSPFRSSVVIVALTASSLQSDRVAALAAGCNDFLTKPVALDWLDKKIIEWGSIKALQMWADPETAKNFQRGQEAKAKAVASQLRIENRRFKNPESSSSSKKGPEIHVQAPTPPPQAASKPVISRRITKSPSPLSRSMVLPSEPPPLPSLKLGGEFNFTGSREANGKAPENGTAAKEGKPAQNRVAVEVPKPRDDATDVPELSLDAPSAFSKESMSFEQLASGPSTPRPTQFPESNTSSAQALIPPPPATSSSSPPRDTATSPVSSDAAHTDTPYQSATSIPPSPS